MKQFVGLNGRTILQPEDEACFQLPDAEGEELVEIMEGNISLKQARYMEAEICSNS